MDDHDSDHIPPSEPYRCKPPFRIEESHIQANGTPLQAIFSSSLVQLGHQSKESITSTARLVVTKGFWIYVLATMSLNVATISILWFLRRR